MSDEGNDAAARPPGVLGFSRRLGATGIAALRSRGELLAVEWQIEKVRLTELLVWIVALLFLGLMGIGLATATLILLFPEKYRVYATAGFTLLYLGGAIAAWAVVRGHLKKEPFAETLTQLKRDKEWLESSN